MREWWSKIRALLSGRRELSADLREELQAHLEIEIQANLTRGMPEQEARRLARSRFGNPTVIQENAQDAWRFAAVENLAKDCIYAARRTRKGPGFAIAAVLSLALGIGGVTAMFSVIRAVLLKPLDYPDSDQLVEVLVSAARRGQPDLGLNRTLYLEMRAAPAFTGFGAASGIRELVTIASDGSEPESVREARVSANFLEILGVNPILGRGFLPSEDLPGGANVALITDRLWKRRFGGKASVFHSAIAIEARPYTIIGVLPSRFGFPWSDYDVWVTRPWEWAEVPPEAWDRVPILRGLARLKPGVTLEEARAELNVIGRQYASTHRGLPGADPGSAIHVERLQESLVRNQRNLLWMLFDAVGLVLLIVCANLSALLLARSAAHSREFAIRSALGAARRRLIQQTLAESILLALAGAALGVVFVEGLLSAMRHFVPPDVAQSGGIHIDGAVLAFTGAISILTGLVFGCLPSLRFSRPGLADFLREQGTLAGRTSGWHASGFRTRGFLVVAQIALSIVLLAGVGLMLESFVRLREVNPGFQPAHLLTMEIALPTSRYNTEQKKQAFWDELVKRVEGLPGVVAGAVSRSVPTTISDVTQMEVLEQTKRSRDERTVPDVQSASPEYFRAFSIPLIQGREFTPQDRAAEPRVAIINERLAHRFWPSYPRGPSPLAARGTSARSVKSGTGCEIPRLEVSEN